MPVRSGGWSALVVPDTTLLSTGPAEVACFVDDALGHPEGRAAFARWLGVADEQLDEPEIRARAARAIREGRWVAIEVGRVEDRAPQQPARPIAPRPSPAAADTREVSSSVSIELLDHRGVPFADFELTLAHRGGRRDRVVLDAAGRHTARRLVPPGPTQVLFPTGVQLPSAARGAPPAKGFFKSFDDIVVPREPKAAIVLPTLDTNYRLVVEPPGCVVVTLDGWSEASGVLVFGTMRVTAEGAFTVRSALRTVLTSALESTLHVVGHADTEGKSGDNETLGLERARSTSLYLDGKREAWAEHAFSHANVAALQAALKWAASTGLACDPGPIDDDWGPATAAALAALRTHAGIDQSQQLGPRDWSAIYDLYDEDLTRLFAGREELASLRARLVMATASMGERWPLDAAQTNDFSSRTNRRVELTRCKFGDEPRADSDELYDGTFAREHQPFPAEGPNADLVPIPARVVSDVHLALPNSCVMVELPEIPTGPVAVTIAGKPMPPTALGVQGRRVYFDVPPLHEGATGDVRYAAHGATVVRGFQLALSDTIDDVMASLDQQFRNTTELIETGAATADVDYAQWLRDSARQRQVSMLCNIEASCRSPAEYARFLELSTGSLLTGKGRL